MALVAATGYIFLAVVIFLSLCAVFLTIWFHRRRAFQPIRARFWWQSEAIVVIILIWANFLAVVNEFPSFGQALYLYGFGILLTAGFGVLIRLCHIYSAYQVAAVYAAWRTADEAEDIEARISQGSFFVKHGNTVQNPRVQAFLILLYAMVQAALWTLVATQPGWAEDRDMWTLVNLLISVVFYMIPMLYFTYNVAALDDGLFLRKEMSILAFVASLGAILYTVLKLVLGDRFYPSIIMLCIVPFPAILCLVGFPLYKSYVWQAEERQFVPEKGRQLSFESFYLERSSSSNISGGSANEETVGAEGREIRDIEAIELIGKKRERRVRDGKSPQLNHILVEPAGRTAFIAFCKLELNHETVLFFLDATRLVVLLKDKQQMSRNREVAIRASLLYCQYIKDGAVLQVNLSHAMQRAFLEAGVKEGSEQTEEHLDREALLEALRASRNEIYMLMSRGPFVRFLRHKLYTDYIAATEPEV